MSTLILILFIILLATLLKTRFGLYLICLILPAYLLRYQFLGIPTTLLELSIYLVFLIWFIRAILNKNLIKKLRRIIKVVRPFLIPVVLFFSAAIISVIISPDKKLSLGVFKGWFFDPLLVFILFLDLVRHKKHTSRLILALFISASAISIFGLYEYLVGAGLDSDGRLNSVFVPANYVSMFTVPIIVLSLAFLKNKSSSKFLLYGYCLLLFINLLALYATKSYGGWLGLFGALVFIWLNVKIPRQRLKYLLLFAFLIIILSLFESQSAKFGRLFIFDTRTSSSTRSEIWRASILMIKEHPIFGIGLGNFEASYRENIPRIAFPPLEWLVVKPHNLYLNLYLEMGILGFLSFIYLLFLFFKKSWPLRQDPLIKFTIAGMLAILLHGLVDTPYFKNDLSVLFWIIIAVVLCRCEEEALRRRSNLQRID